MLQVNWSEAMHRYTKVSNFDARLKQGIKDPGKATGEDQVASIEIMMLDGTLRTVYQAFPIKT